MNPVLAREGRERFRSRRAMPFVSAWVFGMGLLSYVVYLAAAALAESGLQLGRLVATGFMGRFMFQSATLLLMTAVLMVVPGLAALAIVGERERQTLHLLQVTQLTPWQLVVGKLAASLSYFLWLVVAVLPVMALPLLFGGAGLGDVVAALGMLVATAVMLGAVSIWVSSRAKSSRGAVAGAYSSAFVIGFFTLALAVGEFLVLAGSTDPFGGGELELYSMLPSPYYGMVAAVDFPLEIRPELASFATPYTPFDYLLFKRHGVEAALGGFASAAPGSIEVVDGRQLVRMDRPPVWVYTLIFDVVVAGLALWRAAVSVRAPAARTFRVKRLRNVPG